MNHALRMLVLVAFVLALAGCNGEAVVSASDIERDAEQEFSQQFPVESVDCPEDLPAQEGANIQCVLVSEGTSFEMTATVTSVDGDDVLYDLELTAEL